MQKSLKKKIGITFAQKMNAFKLSKYLIFISG